ncbi:GSCFA domain-containing protein [Flavobacterium sp.]|uniref:GSCFA domain-containing protein n=1 Tax=Flavobacterium sp. TaxID=239 RepID=UPI002C40CC91|nr:GSCFA domain-containing protein [Flavobacterium sp.]HSD08206.1 GSCFA domain-containing protein [Flavobacterium sp.]
MNFRTKIDIPKNSNPIDYNSKIVSLGSCFAENMGNKFKYFKFQSETNPFGIIFNPVSIEKIIERVVSEKAFTEEDIFFHNERWHSFEVHSDLSNTNKEQFLESLNQILETTRQQLIAATHIIITYGTSWVYRNIESDNIVANCHKVPQKQFTKELLLVETIKKAIQNTIDLIKKLNPNCNLIFTISPVRHLKDGFVENQRSKAHLITVIHNLLSENSNLQSKIYFPSYEIMMDELRDYRFYAEDMLHPSQVAIDYIWKRFKESSISEMAFDTMEAVESIQKSLKHRPFNPNSEQHQKFLFNLKQKMNSLQDKFIHIEF